MRFILRILSVAVVLTSFKAFSKLSSAPVAGGAKASQGQSIAGTPAGGLRAFCQREGLPVDLYVKHNCAQFSEGGQGKPDAQQASYQHCQDMPTRTKDDKVAARICFEEVRKLQLQRSAYLSQPEADLAPVSAEN